MPEYSWTADVIQNGEITAFADGLVNAPTPGDADRAISAFVARQQGDPHAAAINVRLTPR